MATVKVVLTYDDYAALPNDGLRYELHDGELSVTPAPGRTHQAILIELGAALHAHVRERRLGEVYVAPFDVILSNVTVVQPDIVFVAHDRLHILAERGAEAGPTLAVEILSPSTRTIDRTTKLQLYARYRVPHYWIVDPAARAIDVYRLAGDAYESPRRFSGDALSDLPPFEDLRLDSTSLWRLC
ncbi:MAG: Uma2 family endonuclease [Candidatus Rokubacteria bacterium]|nr:Uma2 family endonuclease [Candidatus Rokubacteria bacterium]